MLSDIILLNCLQVLFYIFPLILSSTFRQTHFSIILLLMQPSLFATQQWTVSRLTFLIRKLLEENEILQDVWVQGEISNLSRPASGHVYFTLKDSSAALKCVM